MGSKYIPPKYDKLVSVEAIGDSGIILNFEGEDQGPFQAITFTYPISMSVEGFNPEEREERRNAVVKWLLLLVPPKDDGGTGVPAVVPPPPPKPIEGHKVEPVPEASTRERMPVVDPVLLEEEASLIAGLKKP